MTLEKKYQSLHENRIFMGGAADVEAMIKNEGVDVIVDLRGEATGSEYPQENVEWIQVPLGDNATEPQDILFARAIDYVVDAYKSGKKVGFHCNGGGGRTGAVAAGTLINLGISNTLEDAEQKAKSIRAKINIKPQQREALEKLYPNVDEN
ncbi:dual specificity protein phosphatase family protein [Paenibacillus sp. OV219]|uniref:protein-tyrosine phosphatase family protein n=1 Tax=Paenibacillus sp. OV219 TaxID=1884377 RepID=UPI0008B089E8|nr:Protein-tyrosine phosphatase [Paenibacillus sp. OV219]